MKNSILFAALTVLVLNSSLHAQLYRAAATDVLSNDGRQWIERKLPPSVITFSDLSGEVRIKAPIASLFTPAQDSVAVQMPTDTLADFTLMLDRAADRQQLSTGKTFNTSGVLIINNISKKTPAECTMVPRTNPADGFLLSVVIKFNPADFGLKPGIDMDQNAPMMVRVTSNYLNRPNNY